QADIIQLLPRVAGDAAVSGASQFGAAVYRDKIDLVRQHAGARFGEIELAAQLLNVTITDDPEAAFGALASQLEPGASRDQVERVLAESPVVAIGSLGQVCD